MKRLIVALAIGASYLMAGLGVQKCIEGGGVYVDGKGCLIENRAICDNIDPNLNDNVTYGWVNPEFVPNFIRGYYEEGNYSQGGVQYNAKFDGSCRVMEDVEVKTVSLMQLLSKEEPYKKEGTFIHYGDRAFDWAYVTNDGSVIAFLKPSEGGFLEYAVVYPQMLDIVVEQNETSIGFKIK